MAGTENTMKNRTIKYGIMCVFMLLFSCTHINYSDNETFMSFKAGGIEKSSWHCLLSHSNSSCHVYNAGYIITEKDEVAWNIEIHFDSLVTGKYPIRADSSYYRRFDAETYLSVGGIADSISVKIDPASGMVTGHFSFLGFNGSDTIHITDGVFLGYK